RGLAGGGWPPWLYAFGRPCGDRRALAACDVVRVFQVTGVIPALVALRLYGVPFVTTYGFWSGRLARSRVSARLSRAVAAAGLAAPRGVMATPPDLAAAARRRPP